jgi:ubiquinone/menaquinone biosynthesis C-methylase UbiE
MEIGRPLASAPDNVANSINHFISEYSMDQRSIEAYDLPQRVASYDGNMEVMHPNRKKMIQIALEVLPFPQDTALRALDLGIGTGYFTGHFLRYFPHATVIAIDGAKAMTDLARTRLGDLVKRVDIQVADFRRLDQLGLQPGSFDVVYSSYALHHLNCEEKRKVVAESVRLLQAGGWFLNADLIVADSPQMEERIQQLRVQGILDRASSCGDVRFRDATTTRAFLDTIEREAATNRKRY